MKVSRDHPWAVWVEAEGLAAVTDGTVNAGLVGLALQVDLHVYGVSI